MTDDPPDVTQALRAEDGATREIPRMAPWLVVSRTTDGSPVEHGTARLLRLVGVGALVVLLGVGLLGIYAAHTLAERQSVNDAANTADLLAEAVVQPALTDAVADGDPAAVKAVSDALADYLQTSSLVRVKLWNRDGKIVYSDEPRLVGQQFDLSAEELAVFGKPLTRAGVSDLDEEENVYERGHGKLLEAYRPVWTPDGTPLLFETYAPYDEVSDRTGQLWRGFAGVTITSLLVFAALLVPLLWGLLSKLREGQRQREALLQRAVDASSDERRRIAGTLHDGVVQELAATSFAVSGAAARSERLGDEALTGELQSSARTLRGSIGGLRTLLVDIYPQSLASAGLLETLRDLSGTLRSRDIAVHLDLPDHDPGLGPEGDRLVFRIAHECLQNVRKHSSAANVWLRLGSTGDAVVLEVADDGVGFDPAAALTAPADGHFGLRVLGDVASDAGAELAVSSAPGAGCRWRLTVRKPGPR
ncbi:sensor histidine kinase [Marmoricola sp. RAF53]|uniref:sensor histidine kinase n=1 Tax=Marmoricola sp. RAF53 TaxID=3233059 RepID=UPI003F979F08